MSSKVFLIQSEGLGRGEDKLGGLLMANFLVYLVKVKRNQILSYSGILGCVWYAKVPRFWTISNVWRSRESRSWLVQPASNTLTWLISRR